MKLNDLTADEIKSRYQKITNAAKYILLFLLLTSIAILFLPPWILNLLSKNHKRNQDAAISEPSLFQQQGWQAVGVAALIIAALLFIFLLVFQWFQLKKKVKEL